MTSIMGTKVDMAEFGEPDGRAKVAEILDASPTFASRSRSAGIAAE